MKTTQPKKKDSMTLTIKTPKARMPRIVQRSATFKSGKQYSRKNAKRIDY